MIYKLGRKAVKTDTRTLRMSRYTAALPAPPAAVDWTKGLTAWGMMLNDILGDCTIAGCGHAIQVCGANVGYTFTGETVPDGMIKSAYSAWDGYIPGNPSTDNGGVELDVLNDWKRDGLGGHHLIGYADPTVRNLTEVKQAISLFAGLYIGLSLPLSAQNQDVWDVVPDPGDGSTEPGSWGGHCVFVPKYDMKSFTCITWGQLKTMTVAFWNKYCDEAHALLLATWIRNNMTPSGFNLQGMQADLADIR